MFRHAKQITFPSRFSAARITSREVRGWSCRKEREKILLIWTAPGPGKWGMRDTPDVRNSEGKRTANKRSVVGNTGRVVKAAEKSEKFHITAWIVF